MAHGFSNIDWTGVRLANFLADAQHSGYARVFAGGIEAHVGLADVELAVGPPGGS